MKAFLLYPMAISDAMIGLRVNWPRSHLTAKILDDGFWTLLSVLTATNFVVLCRCSPDPRSRNSFAAVLVVAYRRIKPPY